MHADVEHPRGNTQTVDKSDFHFDLPSELIAQTPLAERSASRLLVVDAAADRLCDRRFADLPDHLAPGDLLVFNDTRVLPARLDARKESGGAVEILLARVRGARVALVPVRAARKPAAGTHLVLADGSRVRLLGRDGEFFHVAFDDAEAVEDVLLRLGRMPLPPYIARAADAADAERYQTVYARIPGAVAAPTAGLHFDRPLLDELARRGIESGFVTLHVGAGTFQPLRVERIEDHVMHREWFEVSAPLCAQIERARAAGGRIVAVGTTVVRALESALRDGRVQPFRGETRIFIYPGYRFGSLDALITNFHLPESTLLMLVAALAGRERILAAYRHAVARRYRFFSYGDAMLVLPGQPGQPGGGRDVTGTAGPAAGCGLE
jgi:S-adenosylmethionine:tRNA ribosyltransferase-isomerase